MRGVNLVLKLLSELALHFEATNRPVEKIESKIPKTLVMLHDLGGFMKVLFLALIRK